MYEINFHQPIHIHFIGIGGISMSGLAEILLKEGFRISGSDSHESPLTRHLASLGTTVFYGHRRTNITACPPQAVVYTAAVKQDNPELAAAEEAGIPVLTRAELLGQLMRNYQTAIGIAGTHGKTTTTSMVTQILLADHADPTISVGGILPSIGGNIRVGASELFVTEACEYTNSFLSFHPSIEVILNIEADHLDFFKDIDDIRASFRRYAQLLPPGGLLVISSAIRDLKEITQGLACPIVTFGVDGGDYTAGNITYDHLGCAGFDVICRESGEAQNLGRVQLSVPGMHNIGNSLAAIALCAHLDIPFETIAKGLKEFTGTERRFEKKGEIGGITIVDDYAHHPQEITATIKAAGHYPHQRLWVVFQPHTYSRTKLLLDDFAEALSLADEVVLADIYPARETDTLGISSRCLQEKLMAMGTPVHYFPSFDEIEKFLLENCMHGDLLITMGAGDIVKVGESLLGK